ncbi:hypothetical protein SDC9_204649 [bioreactor metagenome]|uniref:Uncharacterized protein n=1 Tax=bioreactor metagenome TaxID=1076179 RepID=A0A645IZS8_9ZZZZ
MRRVVFQIQTQQHAGIRAGAILQACIKIAQIAALGTLVGAQQQHVDMVKIAQALAPGIGRQIIPLVKSDFI